MDKFYGLLCIAVFATACSGPDSKPKTDILSANRDTTVSPGQDFFQYANGTWIKNNPIPAEESGWGIGDLVIEENLLRMRKVNEEAAKATAANDNQQKIGNFWKTAMDSAKIEQDGLKPLQTWLKKIDGISNSKTLQTTMAELSVIGVNGPIDFSVLQDEKNSSVNSLHLWQTGIGLPEKEFYFKQDSTSKAIREAYTRHIAKMLVLLGDDTAHAATAANNMLALETKLAIAHRKREDLIDPYANYNKVAVKDLSKVSPNIEWQSYMSATHINKVDSVIIGQPEYYTAAGIALQNTPVDTWKAYLRYRLADAYAGSLPDAFGAEDFSFLKLLYGVEARRPRWKRVLSNEEDVMGELLGQLYAKEYFNAAAKKRYEDLVEAIRSALKNRIEQLDWMSDTTKQKALAKLAALNKKVGYPNKWKDFSALQIGTESYTQNLMNAAIFWHNRDTAKLGKPVDRDEWDDGTYPQTYNAYYNPSNNEIVLPAGIFTVPGYRDEDLDDALVYGYGGASTIGHEITHGFDNTGRQYDEKGNLVSWWTKRDEQQFTTRSQVMIRQFDQYVAIDTFRINGEATLGENIADLGGILLGWDAFRQTEQYKKGASIGGLTPSQRYFLGYALGWLGNQRDEALRTQVLTDEHSPGKFRVNGPFTDVDAFYTTFNIKPGDKMYIPDSTRVRIW